VSAVTPMVFDVSDTFSCGNAGLPKEFDSRGASSLAFSEKRGTRPQKCYVPACGARRHVAGAP
jgi:hypothetical protein